MGQPLALKSLSEPLELTPDLAKPGLLIDLFTLIRDCYYSRPNGSGNTQIRRGNEGDFAQRDQEFSCWVSYG